jgi:hypothetical protein
MLAKLLRRQAREAQSAEGASAEGLSPALLRVIAERRSRDPSVGVKLGGKEVALRAIQSVRSDIRSARAGSGVHVETVLTLLGGLSGFACRASADLAAQGDGLLEQLGEDGRRYYFGRAICEPLLEQPSSVWSLTAGAAQLMGCREFPDVAGILDHVRATAGTTAFGLPRVDEAHQSQRTPIELVRSHWRLLSPIARQVCTGPHEWPILFGVAVQHAMYLSKGIVEPELAIVLVMESAVPMSCIDPVLVP